jgi:hypothetical protein
MYYQFHTSPNNGRECFSINQQSLWSEQPFNVKHSILLESFEHKPSTWFPCKLACPGFFLAWSQWTTKGLAAAFHMKMLTSPYSCKHPEKFVVYHAPFQHLNALMDRAVSFKNNSQFPSISCHLPLFHNKWDTGSNC